MAPAAPTDGRFALRARRIVGPPAPAAQPDPWPERSVVVIGNFDGVHRGHQSVLAEARRLASAQGLATVVLTFDPHPAVALGREPPPCLTAMPRRGALLLAEADRVAVREFDHAFAQTSPREFAEGLLVQTLGARVVVVGQNFRFGHARAGDLDMLRRFGEAMGFEAVAHPLAEDALGRFSSSRARQAAIGGDTRTIHELLGRPHSFAGLVVTGAQRGRSLGFPTANIAGAVEIVPPRGVYAVRVLGIESQEGSLAEEASVLGFGVFNRGVRPTVADGLRESLEVHVLDFEGDLYGRRLRIEILERLRDEMRFDGLDALKAQIARDVALARTLFERPRPG
ncbi:MAG: bifunctional riboflavin kinase/FAD synthetase [Myxococcales bacterium]|nr:bifunctional riboflavin kinase/FAD synthetase [Myxococcales bacterium]